MGTGIWSMHFVAMLAFHLPFPVQYDGLTTLFSLLYAILASGIALWLLNRPTVNLGLLLGGSLCMGSAIAWMHYIGMAAIRSQVELWYNYGLVILSVGVAILASLVALWLASRLHSLSSPHLLVQKLFSALIMGLAISGMHYTGMEATHFVPRPTLLSLDASVSSSSLFNSSLLASAIGIATLLILALTLITSLFNQWLSVQLKQQQSLQDSEIRFRTLIREMQVGVFLLNANAEVIVSNKAAIDLLGLTIEQVEHQVFGQNWHLLQEDGTPFDLGQLPVQQAIFNGQPVREVVVGVQKDYQACRWLLISAEPQMNAVGAIEQVVCTFSEITRQKHAEVALRQMAERERALTRVLQQMRQTLNLETIFAATTSELRNALGCDRVAIYQFNTDWSGAFVAESVTPGWKVLVQAQESDPSLKQITTEQENCVIA
ncbi:MAG TPA: MHYT domain-containing protein, partial [Allocoleopsis sp.]